MIGSGVPVCLVHGVMASHNACRFTCRRSPLFPDSIFSMCSISNQFFFACQKMNAPTHTSWRCWRRGHIDVRGFEEPIILGTGHCHQTLGPFSRAVEGYRDGHSSSFFGTCHSVMTMGGFESIHPQDYDRFLLFVRCQRDKGILHYPFMGSGRRGWLRGTVPARPFYCFCACFHFQK